MRSTIIAFLLLTGLSFSTLLAIAQSNSAIAYTFTTLAGKAREGSADGVGNNARFSGPQAVAVDSAGNVYVADTANNTIRKVTPAGVVTTLAGLAGFPGSSDGTGSAARFNDPYGVAVDNVGNVYVTDTRNATIRKVTPGGVVTTLAGMVGIQGSADGTGTNAQFEGAGRLAVDNAGNLYEADYGNGTLRKATPMGTNWVVTTLAGVPGNFGTNDGIGNAARFGNVDGVAVDNSGNVYVGDLSDDTIRKVSLTGTNWVVTTFAGTPGAAGSADGTGNTARFRGPRGVAVDANGTIFVADSGNLTIRKITSAGLVTSLAGVADNSGSIDSVGGDARFDAPASVAVDQSGTLYVADLLNNTIRRITSAGLVSTIAGLAGYTAMNDGVGSDARFSFPASVAVDGAANVYVADSGNHTIRRVAPAGLVSTIVGFGGSSGSADGTNEAARFNSPHGLAVDNGGNLYVADSGNHTIRKIAPAGTNWAVSTVTGLAGSSGSADGTNSSARFNRPWGVAVDSAGSLYVADSLSDTIRLVKPFGTNWVVSTLAGFAGYSGSADGTNSGSRFSRPLGVAVDGAGNLYVADTENHTLREISLAGTNWVVSTIAGFAGSAGSTEGAGPTARFHQPNGIAVDNVGNVYVADTTNNTIRKGVFTQYASKSPVSYTASFMNCSVAVTLLPAEANGQWRFPWEFGWHPSGYTATNLVAGNYPIEFRTVTGYLALPIPEVQVTSGNTTAITNVYYPTIGAGDTNSTPGTLTIFLGPTPPPGAGWRFLGDNASYLPNGYTTNLLPGTYLIEFAGVSGRVKPASQAVQITAGQPAFLSVNYLLAATPPVSTYLPFPVPSNQVGDESTYPFGFNGQLQSDNGYGSGVAVANNVVLTAAHLVFNDQTLSYVSRAHWFFRRDSGVSEPLPQAARSFFVQSGYAAQRTNDLASGYSPDQSTPPSRNVDVAALYFQTPVAGGGSGGYLPSDAVPNTWLTSTALKMLVGYPVDGSQFGAVVTAGKMYQSDPQPYPLSVAPDPVPGQQEVYLAPWLLSYPGNSGGPLYVQLNGYYYPAAVYLGTLFSGSQPYASVVRAIDSSVVNLITNAVALGDTGTNNTGGGVITVIPSLTVSSTRPAYMRWQLEPPAAVRAGAAWRVVGDSTYSTATNYTRQVTTTNAFGVEFKPIPGWNLPTNQTALLQPGQVLTSTGFYTVTNPVLVANGSGLGITGTTDTVYRIEGRSSLTTGSWQPVSTNTILTNGLNPVLNNLATNGPAKFYRALWLP